MIEIQLFDPIQPNFSFLVIFFKTKIKNEKIYEVITSYVVIFYFIFKKSRYFSSEKWFLFFKKWSLL
jgi:hypothetical protein